MWSTSGTPHSSGEYVAAAVGLQGVPRYIRHLFCPVSPVTSVLYLLKPLLTKPADLVGKPRKVSDELEGKVQQRLTGCSCGYNAVLQVQVVVGGLQQLCSLLAYSFVQFFKHDNMSSDRPIGPSRYTSSTRAYQIANAASEQWNIHSSTVANAPD